MSKEAMKLALEALEAGEYYIDDLEAIVYAADDLGTHEDRAKMQAAITALREALAQQALDKKAENARELGLDYEPAQRTWVGLTDGEIVDLCDGRLTTWGQVSTARAIEAKLKEKNNG